jgi:hypothetical protein
VTFVQIPKSALFDEFPKQLNQQNSCVSSGRRHIKVETLNAENTQHGPNIAPFNRREARAPHERVDAMPKLVINGRKQSKSVFGGATGKKRAKSKTPRQQVRPRQSLV